jgi:uncharacterized protein
MSYTFKQAEESLIYKVITGSKAYGLDLPTSDTDLRGIYLQPNEYRLSTGYKEQVADRTNDIVYYEVNRFVELLTQNNPNIIENLYVPDDKVLILHKQMRPLYENRDRFLTKRIRFTFGGYAISQIKKARGLNKKIVNPMPKERKTPLDFCYIFEKEDGYMMKAKQWLTKHGFKQEHIGLSEMPNGVQLYKVYYDWLGEADNDNPRYEHLNTQTRFRGIIADDGHDLRHSEIPKGHPLQGFLYYNMDGYSTHCKEHAEYWEWVNNRNPHRYNDNVANKHNYDGKNMMHCLRMLDMAIEIANGEGVNLVRPNREWLLSVRKGQISYEEIMELIEQKKSQMDDAFQKSSLPDRVDEDMVHDLILEMRS